MAANECIPFYEPGGRITGHAEAALSGKRFVRISGNRQSGPGLALTAQGGNYPVNAPTAAGRVFGVTSHDVAAGGKVTVISTPGTVLPVTAAAAIAAFEEVQVDALGRVIPLAGGVSVGVALTAAANGADAEIQLS